MRAHRLLPLLLLPLAACAKVDELHDPDGGVRYLIGCYGALTPMSVCYDKAKELCPRGYVIDDSRDFTGPGLVSEFGTTHSINRQLVIQCNYPGADAEPTGS